LRLRRWARRHPALTGFIAFLSLGLAWSLYLLAREERALEHEQTARASERTALDFALGRHLAQRAINVLDEDASASLALAIKAVGFADHFETRAALLSALAACRMSGVLDGDPARRFLDLQIAPDSKRVIAGLDDGTARVYSIDGGKDRLRIGGHPGEVAHVRIDPRGERIFTASTDGVVRVFDAQSGAPIHELPALAKGLEWIELDRAGELLVALDSGGLARVWSTRDWAQVSELRAEPERFNCVRFAPDAQRLLMFSLAVHRDAPRSNTAIVWETSTGRKIGELAGHGDAITCAEFGASGALAVTASLDGAARLWSIPECQPIGSPLEHNAPVMCARLSPDERQLATGTSAGEASSAWLWDLASGARTALRGEHRERIAGVEFSADGKRIASVSLGMVLHTWSALDGRELSRQSAQIQPQGVMWSPDGQRIVTLAYEPTTAVWFGDNPPDAYALIGHGAPLTSVCFSPDGTRALTAAEDGTARLWHTPRSASERGEFAPGIELFQFGGATNHVKRALFSPDGAVVLTLSRNGEAQCWSAADGKRRGPPMCHPSSVRAAEFSADGVRLVTIADDHKARLFTLDGGARYVPIELDTRATCAHFTADSRRLLVARDDNVLCVFDVETAALVREHIWQSDKETGVVDFAVSADGEQIALACTDLRIRFRAPLVDEAARGSIFVFPMQDIAYNSTGTRLLATGPDKRGAMRLHDLANNSQVRIQIFHSLPVTCGEFSRDGAFVLTASKDKTVLVRRALDGVPFAHLVGHEGSVTCASFSRDDGALRVITGSSDGTARIWPVEPLAPALARAPRRLSDLEDRAQRARTWLGEREARVRALRPDPTASFEHGDDPMHLLLLSILPRASLAIAGLVLSALCAWPRPTDAPAACAPSPALRAGAEPVLFDCNENGIEDSVDIALGASSDQNRNGVPDECEAAGRWIGAR
jgi:WD40 repeat protein